MKKLLHLVSQSPFTHKALEQCLSVFAEGDALMLLNDGVYSALMNQPLAHQLIAKPCYGIESDCMLRGLQPQILLTNLKLVDYPEFVNLTKKYDLVHSWY